MSQARRIAGSSIALAGTNVVNKAAGLLVMLSVARFLGAEQFGLYTYVFVYVAAFGLLTDLGLTTVVMRGISQGDDVGARWLGHALAIRWPLALAVFGASAALALALWGPGERAGLIALSSLQFLTVPLQTHTAIYHARLAPWVPALATLASRVALLAAVQWLARAGSSLQALVAVEIALGAATSVALWLGARGLLRPIFGLDRALAWRLLREGVPLFLTSVFIALYFRIDVFFLEHYRTDEVIGIYAAAYRITEALPLVAAAVSSSVFPVLCRQVSSGQHAHLVRLVRMALKVLMVAIVPVSLVLAFHSPAVTRILYGARFDGAAPLLAILAAGQILVYTNVLLSTLLVARGQSHLLMLLTLGMLAFNLALNWLVIPRHGAHGAAATTVATELAGTAGCLVLTSTGRLFGAAAARLALPAAGCAALLYLLVPRGPGLSPAALGAIGAIALVYLGSLFLFRVFNRDEWRHLRQLAWP